MNNLAFDFVNIIEEEPSKINKRVRAKTKGYSFDLWEREWILDKNSSVNLDLIYEHLNEQSLNSFIHVLAFYASNLSASHTHNIAARFKHMLRITGSSKINDIMLINYRAFLSSSHEWYLGTIRGFLRKWYELGYDGIDEDVIRLLDGWTLQGNRKGDAVKRKDPNAGPLSDNELKAFNEGAVIAFEKNLMSYAEETVEINLVN